MKIGWIVETGAESLALSHCNDSKLLHGMRHQSLLCLFIDCTAELLIGTR